MLIPLHARPALLRAHALSQKPSAPRRLQCRASSKPERDPRPENVAGDFFVDHTCIDCDTCRWMAPDVFARVGSMSAVTRQPQGEAERQEALRALLSCPTFSIHARTVPGELAAARDSLPHRVPGCADVLHCGHHAENSYGATPYLILRDGGGGGSSGGNILVDVPRWTPALARRIEGLGGLRWIFLTHKDDVSDHAAWASHFDATRIIHRLEANARQGTDKAEWKLDGEGPWLLGDDVELVFTPGHTAGCVTLLYKPDRALLTGDHLAFSHRLGRLTIFRNYNWHSVSQQLESVAKLLPLEFLHVLPGHGCRTSFAALEEKNRELRRLLEAEGWKTPAQGVGSRAAAG